MQSIIRHKPQRVSIAVVGYAKAFLQIFFVAVFYVYLATTYTMNIIFIYFHCFFISNSSFESCPLDLRQKMSPQAC